MKKTWIVIILALVASLAIVGLKACRPDSGGGGGGGGGYGAQHMIPGPDEPGYDAVLEEKMHRYFIAYKTFASAPFGMSLDGYVENQNDREVIERFVNDNPNNLGFKAFCLQDINCIDGYTAYERINGAVVIEPGIIKYWDEWGDLGMFGGVAAVGEFYRYAVLKEQGYPDADVAEARQRVFKLLDALHMAHTIHGVPGILVRGLKPKDIVPDEILYPFTDGLGNYIPEQKDNTMRDDMSGLYPEWSWMDSTSGDQVDGWLLMAGVAWDIISEDPDIPQNYKDQMVEDARALGDMLMAVSPESDTDMLIRDADGRLVKFCNVHPNVASYGEGCPEFAVLPDPTISFEAIMGLGFIRVLYHITGDEKLRAFYYDELIEVRQWHNFIYESPWTMADMGYATSFSNVNMVFVAYYNAIRYESDPAIRANLQHSLEIVLWDNGGIHQPAVQRQPWYDFIYAGLRSNGFPHLVAAGGIQTLDEWPEPPNFNDPVINCDADEIAQGWCLAVNGVDIIELPPPEFRGAGGDLIAEHVVPRRVRGHSNFDWRSNPFEPNRGGNGRRLNPNGEMLAAYWMGRYLKTGAAPDRNISPIARTPEPPGAPAGLTATAMSEDQIDLGWTDADHLEAEFVIERRALPDGDFAEAAAVDMDVTGYTDLGLTPGVTYEYRVMARSVAGASDYSNVATATTLAAPAAAPASAANLAALALDHQSIQLNWDDVSGDETAFKIMRQDAGLVATVLADVTAYIDQGLADDTTYNYVVVAQNSAGDAWPSNEDTATTDKLPSIFAAGPLEDEFQVKIDIGQIKAGFGDPVLPGDVTFEVQDEVGTVAGTWILDGPGTELTFTPDEPLLTMSTQYAVTITVLPAVHEYVFNTEGASWTVNIDDAVGKAFAMSIFDGEIVEPAAVAPLLGALGIEMYLILGVLDADSAANELTIIGALGNPTAPDPNKQDLSQPTLLFPARASTDDNPAWEIGPFNLPLFVEGFQIVVREVYISGIFEGNFNYSGKGEFRGGLDLGPLAVLAGMDPAELCVTLQGACSECPGDPGRVECVQLYIRNMRANKNADPVVPVAQVVPLDLGGSANNHTIALILVDPATGAPQNGVQLKVSLTSGNGAVDGGAESIVTTGPDGKTIVVVSDPDGGTDEILITIESAVGYLWVPVKINVIFD